MPLPAIVHWEGNHWIVLYDVDEQFVRVADPARRACGKFRAANLKRSGQDTRRCSITRPHSNKRRKASRRWRGSFHFSRKFKVILLQVLGLAVAVSFLQLLFPVFTQMVVDKVIVENDVGLLKTILLGMFAAIVFVQLSTLAQEYLLAFAAVRLDTASSRFSEPETSFPADDLFHEPADRRHSTPARWREAGSAICRPTGNRRVAGAVYLVGASF